MSSRTFVPTITLLVKGLKTLDQHLGKLPAGTVCVQTVSLPGALPPGTVAVQAVKLRGATMKQFGGFAVQPVRLPRNGILPEGCVLVDTVKVVSRKHGPSRGLAIEAIKVLEPNLVQSITATGIRVPEIPAVIAIPKRRGGKLGIRVPVVPPKIRPKK